mgnify:CR=1 FL=1|tara:strand:+ start:50 stop:442 length:393 start_codon:yes stop_codon:yes gene_type:complete
MHTKQKGDIGQLIVATDLTRRGWNIAFPYGENIKYDLIAEKNGICRRVQVKAVTPKNGALRVNCRSSNNWSVRSYKPNDFEVLAAVDLKNQNVYFIPSDRIKKNLMNLRLSPAKNEQKININFAEDFITF